ncbi:hypothetical protein VTK26DRAFT_6472 [Humicola hyalothermophila]
MDPVPHPITNISLRSTSSAAALGPGTRGGRPRQQPGSGIFDRILPAGQLGPGHVCYTQQHATSTPSSWRTTPHPPYFNEAQILPYLEEGKLNTNTKRSASNFSRPRPPRSHHPLISGSLRLHKMPRLSLCPTGTRPDATRVTMPL